MGIWVVSFVFIGGGNEDRRDANKHVPVSIALRPCVPEACAGVPVCAPEWPDWASGDAIILSYFKNLLHQFAFPHPKMLDRVFTSIGDN